MQSKGGPRDNSGSNRGNKAPSAPPKQPESKPKDYSTAILDRKKAPHRLIAEDGQGPSEDASVIQLTQKKNG